MKRLLAYLFTVLGLGLMLNVNAFSKISTIAKYSKGIFCIVQISGQYRFMYSENQCNDIIPKYTPRIIVSKNSDFKLYKSLHHSYINLDYKAYPIHKLPSKFHKIIQNEKSFVIPDSKVAKSEPSQTQEVDKLHVHLIKPDTWVYFIRYHTAPDSTIWHSEKYQGSHFLDNEKYMKNYKFDENDNIFKYEKKIGGVPKKYIRISKKLNDLFFKSPGSVKQSEIANHIPNILKDLIDEYTENEQIKKNLIAHFDQEKLNIKPKNKVKVAKAEPSQTQKVAKSKLICTIGNSIYWYENMKCSGPSATIIKPDHSMYDYFSDRAVFFPLSQNTQIAKVEEPKQEEFKPENKDIDNDAPVIEIAQNIIVSDTSYVIEGKVSDKSDKIFVEIDGQPIEVKKGKFKANRYSPVDEQIKIVAIDQWGNKSKPKLVNIKIKLDETAIAEKLEPLNPSNIKTKSSKNKIAIIIGIENYAEAPKANYANLDAQYFFDYARRAFGVKKQNINLLINEDATVVKTDKALSLWLKSKIKKNRSELIIFFAGHGLASTDGKELYLLPQDGNPDRLKRTALSRTDLFREIIELNPKSVTMFLDTCYSGVSRDEQMLLASARPLRIVADEQEGIPDNFTIFSASKLDQISSGLTEVNHGIFSYYLMKGLEGYADFNEDKKITNGELLAYMDENVSQKAAEQGREQNPSLAGDPNKVLINYR